MLRVGITGDMGAGKTWISKLFEALGVEVFNCDRESKWLILNNPALIEGIKKEFGNHIYDVTANVFKELGKIIFVEGDKTKLNRLMEIVAPHLTRTLGYFYDRNKDKGFCLVESAVLFEYGMEEDLDRIIYVSASYSVRLARTMKRDGITEQQYKTRMEGQMNRMDKIAQSRFLIVNDGKPTDLLQHRVSKIYKFLNNENEKNNGATDSE